MALSARLFRLPSFFLILYIIIGLVEAIYVGTCLAKACLSKYYVSYDAKDGPSRGGVHGCDGLNLEEEPN